MTHRNPIRAHKEWWGTDKLKRLLPYLALALVLAQLLLMLVSWIYSAAIPASGVRSLLSSEGVRWFFSTFSSVLATPVLVWLLLLAAAFGCLSRSGLLTFWRSDSSRRPLLASLSVLLLYVVIVLLMTVVPHAVLLSASGRLWPSPFSASLVPLVAFGLLLVAIVYGVLSGRFRSLSDVWESTVYGLRQSAPLLLFYILAAQLLSSLLFVLP
jgi:aminobenzoyl-glutamate transport protein